MRRGYVVNDQFVAPLLVILAGEFDRIAEIDVVLELHPFRDSAVYDVQARDYPSFEHGYLRVEGFDWNVADDHFGSDAVPVALISSILESGERSQ